MNRRIARTAQVGALVLALVLVPAALAAKGGGGGGGNSGTGGSSTISQPVMVTDRGTPGLSYGDTVTFNVSTTVPYPSVQLACYRNGGLIFDQIAGFFPGYMWSKNYTLQSSSWSSGGANCTATLYYTTRNGTNATLATSSFAVSA
jgi:hypothetical protein